MNFITCMILEKIMLKNIIYARLRSSLFSYKNFEYTGIRINPESRYESSFTNRLTICNGETYRRNHESFEQPAGGE